MADHPVFDEPKPTESLLDKIQDKIYGHDSSSSDSDSHKSHTTKSEPSINNKIWRLFGREKHVHQVFGGGRPADVFLWRNKKISAGVLVGATAVWVIFELLEYNLVGLVCNCLMLTLAILFLWSNATHLINKSPPNINKVEIPEDLTVDVALSLRYEVNRGFALLREISLERDLKKFLVAIGGLWLFSVVGSCCSFLTLLYITFVLLHTVPVLYEKYEDKVDPFAEKATAEIKKHYAVVHAKYLSKIPRTPLKAKKLH